jgi:hypothetical protein
VELGAAVLLLVGGGIVGGDGLGLAEADGEEAIAGDPLGGQVSDHREGALAGELEVHVVVAVAVGVALDAEQGHLRVLLEELLELVERGLGLGDLDGGLAGVKDDGAGDHDAATLGLALDLGLAGGLRRGRRRRRGGGRGGGRRGRRRGSCGGRAAASLGVERSLAAGREGGGGDQESGSKDTTNLNMLHEQNPPEWP